MRFNFAPKLLTKTPWCDFFENRRQKWVTRYRMHLEQLGLAPSTINQRLAVVRRLAYEASDAGLLSPELAAGIKRVKGAKQLGVRLGNRLSAEQGRALVEAPRGRLCGESGIGQSWLYSWDAVSAGPNWSI